MIPAGARALVSGWATVAGAFIKQYLGWLQALIALAVLVAAGWGVWRVMSWREGFQEREAAIEAQQLAEAKLAAELACEVGTECETRTLRAAQDGADAVTAARQAAADAAEVERLRLLAEGATAVARAQAVATEARKRADRWQAKYQEAVSSDAICRAWSEMEVPCPTE